MKVIIYAAFAIFPLVSSANGISDNLTCALSKTGHASTVTKQTARKVLAFEKIKGDVFDLKEYSARTSLDNYETYDTTGSLIRLKRDEDGKLTLGKFFFKSSKDSEYLVIRTEGRTGGYPGAGPGPRVFTEYKCLVDYVDVETVIRKDVIKDFNL